MKPPVQCRQVRSAKEAPDYNRGQLNIDNACHRLQKIIIHNSPFTISLPLGTEFGPISLYLLHYNSMSSKQ